MSEDFDRLLPVLARLRSTALYQNSFEARKTKSLITSLLKGRRSETPTWTQARSCHSLHCEEKTTYTDLPKCRDCHAVRKGVADRVCRFQDFRTFEARRGSQKPIVGFLDFSCISEHKELELWLPSPGDDQVNDDEKAAELTLKYAGDLFCRVVAEERRILEDYKRRRSENGQPCEVAYKRILPRVREICDVCETTLFNYHWICRDCGFVACIDCFKEASGFNRSLSVSPRKNRTWFTCTNRRQDHRSSDLMLTQFIPGDILFDMNLAVHFVREVLGIPHSCSCEKVVPPKKPTRNRDVAEVAPKRPKLSSSPVADGNPPNAKPSSESVTDEAASGVFSPDPVKFGGLVKRRSADDQYIGSSLKDVIAYRLNTSFESGWEEKVSFKTCNAAMSPRGVVEDSCCHPMRGRASTLTSELYPGVPHSYLCNGKMLWLHDASLAGNISLFQREWKAGQPVLVSNVGKKMRMELWLPKSFSEDFGDERHDLVNCLTGRILPEQPMRTFWEGFDDRSKRFAGADGRPMLLKLKDWPPGADFADVMPGRFVDVMDALPIAPYTRRNGALNLAAYLPVNFLAPDLGPKMYIAYGSAAHHSLGTTNLHLDISDAINVMAYVGISGMDKELEVKKALDAVICAGCDLQTIRGAGDPDRLPGALWHIYEARDAPRIRNFLHRVAREKRESYGADSDPIHDQQVYLDNRLRARLYEEYGITGYAFVQCLGDAVFIPAGAPHQVRNLLNCIKVAEDFVSAETLPQCFELTQEFRRLSEYHTNHEDKLQIKNIVYQSVRHAVLVLFDRAIDEYLRMKDEAAACE